MIKQVIGVLLLVGLMGAGTVRAADDLFCPAGAACSSHLCTIACSGGEFCINGTAPCDAAIYADDVNNCGGSNIRCGSGLFCKMGECVAGLGDLNSDGYVDIIDIGILIDSYNKVPIINPKTDINKDQSVDIIDMGLIIDNYKN